MSELIKVPPVLPPPEIAPPPRDSESDPHGPRQSSYRLHPFSGLLIILIDNLFWGAETLTAYLATPILCVLSFFIVSVGVFLVQRFLQGDRTGASGAKAFISGVLAGVPFSIAGTLFGTAVLFISGLSALGSKGLKSK
ncbi:MAG: hypothetical protein AB1705_08735 [Verrucomicrobiota bacterium]